MKWPFRKKTKRAINPHIINRRSFYSGDVNRLLSGWVTTSNSIDSYLKTDLVTLRARSRGLVRQNPYGKRFITAIKANVIGPDGVTIQVQTQRNGKLDAPANDSIEAAWREWGKDCDYEGRLNWRDMQNLAIASAGQDGEFMFQVIEGANAGKYGYQLRIIDPDSIHTDKNKSLGNGEIRLGVEYDSRGRVVRYWFKDSNSIDGFDNGKSYSIAANEIIHGYINEWPKQSRGIPWMHASLERTKHLEKYNESAIVAARAGANNTQYLRSKSGDEYSGQEVSGDDTLDVQEAGTIKNIGDREIESFDPNYPHQMYDAFIKSTLRGISAGIGVSYHAISNDLEGVNYSSIRAGVLEDREIYKGLQKWFIHSLIQPAYERWLVNAVMRSAITIGTRPLARPVDEYLAAHYQGRRWAWVDPQKDGVANQLAIENRTKSRSQIMRDQGDDPESVWREIERENLFLKDKGIMPVTVETIEVTENAEEN